ncbi:hypothetical protein [Pseudomonas sp. MWU16-30322]|uniref:hypothetical protein n=1 Tax=Pseudomonas sp. MWU16-30322 TaxID=2878092 RepID=UPI001CFC23D3|nr:hypothetical protein [Pseudomonas sp. MWU16-30322]
MSTFERKPGDIDPSFGEKGVVTLAILPHANGNDRQIKGLYRLPTGKLLLGITVSHDDEAEEAEEADDSILYTSSYYGLARLNEDGRLDPTFASKGFTFNKFYKQFDALGGKVAMHGSRIYMQGGTTVDKDTESPPVHLVLGRFNENGVQDLDFATQGKLILQNLPTENCLSDTGNVAVQADGMIVVGATYYVMGAPERTHAVLYRVTEKGQPDKDFASDGRLDIKLHATVSATSISAMHLLDSGKILIAGSATRAERTQGYFARLNPDGSMDKSYGNPSTPGVHLLNLTHSDSTVQGLVKTAEGGFFGLGHSRRAGQSMHGLLVKMDENGKPNPHFNRGEPLLTLLEKHTGDNWCAGFIDSENRITVAGSDLETHIARFLGTGDLDKEFGTNGFLSRDTSAMPASIFLQPRADEKFIFAGNVTGVGGPYGNLWGFFG